MSDFEAMCRIITKFPRKDPEGPDCSELKKFRKAGVHAIYFATDDSYCWAGLYFNKDGDFVGFTPP